MQNIYQSKISLVVSSKRQEIFDHFIEEFYRTTENFTNITLNVSTHADMVLPKNRNLVPWIRPLGVHGTVVILPILKGALNDKTQFFGDLNDDLFLSEGWLEDALQKITTGQAMVASPGIADTNDKVWFDECVEKTKNEVGVENYMCQSCILYDTRIYRMIGLPDPTYPGACDDMDLWWRFKLNKVPYGMSRKITVGHWVGSTTLGSAEKSVRKRIAQQRSWMKKYELGKEYFMSKHGYNAYHHLQKEMKSEYAKYFKQFRHFTDGRI